MDCFKQFRFEGCIPDLIMLAEGYYGNEEVSGPIRNVANEILDKIVLEGKDDALL